MSNLLYPTWGTPTAPQLIASIGLENATSLAYDVLSGVQNLNNLAGDARAFADALQDPNQKDFWGNNVMDNTLVGLGQFGVSYPTAPTSNVTGIAVPADLLIEAITTPLIDPAPTYTQNNLGFIWDESQWDLSLLTTVQAKLLYDLANGGYGIEPSDEAALWQREREREQLNGEAGIQEAARQAGARGFMLPPGVFYKQMQAAGRAALEKSSSASRDIAMKRADLYVQNRQFTIEKAIETERALVEYLSSYYGRKLDALKANLDAYRISVEIYDAQVKAYMAKLGAQEAGIRMKVEVIDAQVKTNMAAISKYEAVLQGEIKKAELGLENYKAQIQVSEAYVDGQYKAQSIRVAGAEARLRQTQTQIQNTAEMNKTKLAAMENIAKLYLEPAQALAAIANAYIGGTSSIALASS